MAPPSPLAALQETSEDAKYAMCHVFVSKVKSGPAAGTFVPLASIVVTDQSDVKMKVVLWRRAAFWALTVHPGDILLVTGNVWHAVSQLCGGGASPCRSSVPGLVTSSALINFGACYLATTSRGLTRFQRGPTLKGLTFRL